MMLADSRTPRSDGLAPQWMAASAAPLYCGLDAEPETKQPPWIQTSTARAAEALVAPVAEVALDAAG